MDPGEYGRYMDRGVLRFFRKVKIRKQLYVIYFMAVFMPITVIGSFLLISTSNLLTNYHRDLLKSDNVRMKTTLFEITTQIYNISEELAFDESIQDVISGEYSSRSDMAGRVSEVGIIDNYEYNYAEIENIEIYTDNPELMDYKQFHRADEEIREAEWFQRAASQSSVFWIPMMSTDKYGNEYWNLCLVRRIPLIDSRYNGVLVIKISDNYLKTRINSQEYKTMVSVDEGPVFFSSDRQAYGERQKVEINYDESYYQYVGNMESEDGTSFVEVSTLYLYQSESRVYICTANDQAYDNIRRIIFICLAIIGVAILIPGVIIHFFTSYFTSRILTLRQAMHQASNEDYEIGSSMQGQDEVSEAFSDLEVMVQKIKQKDADMYEARLNEKELVSQQQAMEFKMLSSQINPHFLYNTLETIRMKAFTAGDREVATSIKLLGKSLRYVLENIGTNFTTLSRELEHVKVYLSIQKLRFGDKFDSSFELQEGIDADGVYILPLLLQPIVENAILHGLEERESGGVIRIAVHKREGEGTYAITVSDNGCGMTAQELVELTRNIEIRDSGRTKSIGLYNINQRLKLSYGPEYGLKILSKIGQGTSVRMMIPAESGRTQDK